MTDLNTHPENGAVIEVALDKLKASPRNARKTPHAPSSVEALAASIAAKGVIQPLVVEPERDREGQPTGFYLVTVGEGRRQALRLRAKRKQIARNAPVRCVVDLANDPFEVSLDENVTRFAMHPADQFEAFQELATARGLGPEEIGARFGVTPTVVKQRLKLARVSPKLLALYRDDAMTLDQLMVFTITDDHARQEAVWDGLAWNKEPHYIKRALTEDRVRATDRRAVFVGEAAYAEAGGVIERDLFAEDHGGYFADPALLDRLALERLGKVADEVAAEGWKWVSSTLEAPTAFQMGRTYPRRTDFAPEDQQRYDAVQVEYDATAEAYDRDDDPDGSLAAALERLSAERNALDAKRLVFDPEVIGRAGAFVTLAPDGTVKVERGYVRAEDQAAPEAEDESEDPRPAREPRLSDKLVADLTAHRTAALGDRLAQHPALALAALVHAVAGQTFGFGRTSCLEVRVGSVNLSSHAPGIREGIAGAAIAARHEAWAAELPEDGEGLWEAILAMDPARQLQLLAHCLGLTVNALRFTDAPRREPSPADRLATALGLDMRTYWTPTVEAYLGRISKGFIAAAVREGVSDEAAQRLGAMKKADMAQTAGRLLDGRGWLPEVLRTDAVEGEVSRLEAAE